MIFSATIACFLELVALKRADVSAQQHDLASKTVQSAALAFQRVHDVHGSNSLPLGVFRVRDGITDDILKENLENTASLLVDQSRDTLDTTSTSKTSNSRLRDSLDVITKNLPVTLCATLS